MRLVELRLIPAAAAFALVLAGCGGGSSNGNQSLVRTFNAYVPQAGASPALSIAAGGTVLSGGSLPFGIFANGGGFTSIPNGAFNPVGTGPGLSGSMQFTSPPTLNSAVYTLVAAGQAGQTGAHAPQFLLVSNYTQNVLIIPQGQTAVRVINVSANPNPVGLFATSGGIPTTAVASAVSSVPYGFSDAANPYVAVPTSQLRNLALVDTANPTVPLALSSTSNLNTLVPQAGEAYTLYVYGQPGSAAEPFGATWVLDWPIL